MGTIREDYLTDDDFDDLIDKITDGRTTRQIAHALGKDRVNIFKWLNMHASEEQRNRYVRALDLSADAMFEDGIEAALDDSLDIGFKDDGTPFVKGESVSRSRLKFDALTKGAAHRRPKAYGNRQTTVQEGGDKPVQVEHSGEVGLVSGHIDRILGK